MTNVSLDDVQHLAQLSSLQLNSDEADNLRTDIEGILKYIEQLGELDTSGVEPTYQVTDRENVWRADVVDQGGIPREELLARSPASEKNQIKVPKVL
jgi:aspartyl-tRNA(Asn)/glutamyl-tRNA(Gln) amidotransferase subunit C